VPHLPSSAAVVTEYVPFVQTMCRLERDRFLRFQTALECARAAPELSRTRSGGRRHVAFEHHLRVIDERTLWRLIARSEY
jgi:hypothetical protein